MAGEDELTWTWYCLQVAPQKEFASERILRENGFHAFCPTETKLRKPHKYVKRKVPHTYPLMIRYIFVGLGAEETNEIIKIQSRLLELFRFRLIKAIVVGQEGRPLAIPAREMDRVFLMSKAPQPYKKAANPHRAFRIGEEVEIISGPYAGRVVKVEDIKGQKARVMLEMFGRELDVPIPLEFLEVA